MTAANTSGQLRIVPANEASWDDLQAIFSAGEGRECQCQFFKLDNEGWRSSVGIEERTERLREQTRCGDVSARSTTGLVAYWEGEAAGWCAVEPRTAYPRLLRMRVPWAGRDENKADDGVWVVTCFVVRKGYRDRGIASALARASVDFACERGARAVEGYPKVTRAGEEVAAAALYVGSWNLLPPRTFEKSVGRHQDALWCGSTSDGALTTERWCWLCHEFPVRRAYGGEFRGAQRRLGAVRIRAHRRPASPPASARCTDPGGRRNRPPVPPTSQQKLVWTEEGRPWRQSLGPIAS